MDDDQYVFVMSWCRRPDLIKLHKCYHRYSPPPSINTAHDRTSTIAQATNHMCVFVCAVSSVSCRSSCGRTTRRLCLSARTTAPWACSWTRRARRCSTTNTSADSSDGALCATPGSSPTTKSVLKIRERESEWSCEEKKRRGNCFVTIFGLLVASKQATKSNDEVVLGQLYSADVIINSLIHPGG